MADHLNISPYDAFIPFYPAHDLAATRDFYGRELGLQLEREQSRCLIFRAAGGYLGFCLYEGALPEHDCLTLCLVSPDVDAVYQRLRRLGIEVEGPPKRNDHYRIYHFFARDPDGYRVEVRMFIEPLHG